MNESRRGFLSWKQDPPSSTGWFLFSFLLVGLGLAIGAGCPGVAHAADPHEDYDLALAKGLHAYSQHHNKEAERLLGAAFTAKPGDPVAGYYLGQVLLRLNRYGEAEERFRDILRQHPTDGRARLGLAMALYHQGRHAEASNQLTAAESDLHDEPLLYYYAGLAASAQQSHKQAAEKFLRAGELDRELARDPRFQQGARESSKGQYERATAEFRAAALAGGPGVAAPPSRPPAPARESSTPTEAKRWNLSGVLSLQYDSNVVLAPAGVQPSGAAGITQQGDFVTVFASGGEYRFIQDDQWTVGTGYHLYQNVHATLSDFNVQTHTPMLYAQRRFGAAQLRFQYLLDYVAVGGDSFLLSHTLQPVLTLPESERTFTQAFVRFQSKDFKDFDLDRARVNPTRDATNWAVGAMQYLMFADQRGHVRAGYVFDTDRTGGGNVARAIPGQPSKADWSYVGHRFSTGIGYQPWPATKLDLAFDYYRQGYDNPNSFSFDGTTVRRDNIFLLTSTAVRELQSWLWVGFQYSYTRDDANIPAFSYVRHIVSFTIGGRF